MAGIRSFNVGKAATPGNIPFRDIFRVRGNVDFEIYGYYIVTRVKCD